LKKLCYISQSNYLYVLIMPAKKVSSSPTNKVHKQTKRSFKTLTSKISVSKSKVHKQNKPSNKSNKKKSKKDITKRPDANFVKSTKRQKLNNSSFKKTELPKVSQLGVPSKAEVESMQRSLAALKSEERELEDKVRKLEAQVTDVELIQAETKVLKEKVDVYKVQSISRENELNEKKKRLQKQKAAVKELNEKVIQLNDDHVSHEKQVNEYIEKAENGEALLKASNEELLKYKDNAETLGKNQTVIQAEVEELKKNLTEKTLIFPRKQKELKEKDQVHNKQTRKLQNELDTAIANLSMEKNRLEEAEREGVKVRDLFQKVGELKAQLEARKTANAEVHEKLEKRFSEMTCTANELKDEISEKEVTISNLQKKETDLELSNQKLNGEILSQKYLCQSKMAVMTKVVKDQTSEKDGSKTSQLDQVKNESEICKVELNSALTAESKGRDSAVKDIETPETLMVEEEPVESAAKAEISSKKHGAERSETTQNFAVEELEATIGDVRELAKKEMESVRDKNSECADAKTSHKLEYMASFSMVVGKEKEPVLTSG